MTKSALVLLFISVFAFQSCANTEGQEKSEKAATQTAAVKPSGENNNKAEKEELKKLPKLTFWQRSWIMKPIQRNGNLKETNLVLSTFMQTGADPVR